MTQSEMVTSKFVFYINFQNFDILNFWSPDFPPCAFLSLNHRIGFILVFFINLVGISWTIIKQVLVILLSFSSSLARKCLSLNDEACMAKPTVIDLNPIELTVIHS